MNVSHGNLSYSLRYFLQFDIWIILMNLSPTPTSSLELKLLVLLLIFFMNYIYKFREDFDLKRLLSMLKLN